MHVVDLLPVGTVRGDVGLGVPEPRVDLGESRAGDEESVVGERCQSLLYSFPGVYVPDQQVEADEDNEREEQRPFDDDARPGVPEWDIAAILVDEPIWR